jgi:hypothetical protein
MGNVRWKKWQKWSYVLYALLFIHATGIQVGGMLNPRGGGRAQVESVQTVSGNEVAATTPERRGRGERPATNDNDIQPESENRQSVSSNQREVVASPAGSGHGQSASVADIKVGQQAKQYIHIISLVLIFGSYLFLRLRKARTRPII